MQQGAIPVRFLRLILCSSLIPYAITGLPIQRGENEFPVPPRIDPPNPVSSACFQFHFEHWPMFNYPPCISDLPATRSESRAPVPPHGHPPGVINPTILRDSTPPKKGSPEEKWIDRLARNTRKMFLCGL